MPLARYGVLKGRPIRTRLGEGQSPHYQVHIIDDTTDYRIAVNVKSKLSPSELLYLVDEDFDHPILTELRLLPAGFTPLQSQPGGAAIDFIRGNFFEPRDMRPLPFNVPGPDNDLNERIDAVMSRALADEEALVYAFGQRWGPEANKKDKYFGFLPGNGIHDIHMNQGNIGQFAQDNGVWQDGALLVQFPAADGVPEQWVGVFLAFQSQAWHTDDVTGHALSRRAGRRTAGRADRGRDRRGRLHRRRARQSDRPRAGARDRHAAQSIAEHDRPHRLGARQSLESEAHAQRIDRRGPDAGRGHAAAGAVVERRRHHHAAGCGRPEGARRLVHESRREGRLDDRVLRSFRRRAGGDQRRYARMALPPMIASCSADVSVEMNDVTVSTHV